MRCFPIPAVGLFMARRDKRGVGSPIPRLTEDRRVLPVMPVADAQQDQPQVKFTLDLTEPTEGRQVERLHLPKTLIVILRVQSPLRVHGQMVNAPITILVDGRAVSP